MSSGNVILFYDVLSSTPGRSWSPNTWKTRYSLNYKGLAYRTIWVDFLDISAEAKKMGATPTRVDPDGTPAYTLPMIYDPSTGETVSDSLRIAQYLDATYPDTPRLIPQGAEALHHAFISAFASITYSVGPLIALKQLSLFSVASRSLARSKREEMLGMRLEELVPTTEAAREAAWGRFKDGLGVVDGWLRANGPEKPFVMGDMIAFADFAIAGWWVWFRLLWGENSEEWRRVESWHGGRWGILLKRLERFEVVA